MKVDTLRDKLMEEIAKIPDDKVPEIFDFLYHFRIGLGVKTTNPQKILQLAGSWDDLSKNEFEGFLNEITTRRKKAFLSRRDREASIG
jgi:hypothetical protein